MKPQGSVRFIKHTARFGPRKFQIKSVYHNFNFLQPFIGSCPGNLSEYYKKSDYLYFVFSFFQERYFNFIPPIPLILPDLLKIEPLFSINAEKKEREC